MAEARRIYVIDTSSWLRIDEHPARNRILDALGKLLENGQLKAPPEVAKELKKIGVVQGWFAVNKEDIIEDRNSDIDFLKKVGEVTHQFPAMAAARSSKEKADQYVVALAACGSPNPGPWIVVADETLDRRPNRKIPTACGAFGVQCVSFLEMLRHEFPDDGW